MYTHTSDCTRLVLVRGVQTEQHIPQTKGDFDRIVEDIELSSEGERMAHSLRYLQDYLQSKRFCCPRPETTFHMIIDREHQGSILTAEHVDCPIREEMSSTSILKMFGPDMKGIVNNEGIYTYLIFTSTTNIRKITRWWLDIPESVGIGPAVGSTTVLDILPDKSIFLHELGSCAALQHGGYDTSKLYWWNNERQRTITSGSE